MTEIWVWRVYELHADDPLAGTDVTGFEVEASDGHIGKVDAATYEAGRGSIVVDTGFWIFGKRRMIPAGVVESVDPGSRTVRVSCTKAEVKDAPDYEAASHDDPAHLDAVGGYYDRFRGDTIAPVAGTGRSPDELSGDPIGPTAGVDEGGSRPT